MRTVIGQPPIATALPPRNNALRRPRILIVTMHYLPEPNFITADVARALTAVGGVTVITTHPNYPYGRFYPGTRFWRPTRSVEDGVVVWRLPFVPDHSRSVLRRGFSYLSFAIVVAVFAPLAAGPADVVWVYHGPFTTAIAAFWYRFIVRARVILTIADLWPESLGATGVLRDNVVMRAMYAYSRFVARCADLIIGSTRGIVERCANDGLPRDRLRFIPVWVDGIPDLPRDSVTARDNARGRHIVYAGNLGPAQNLETVVQAAATLLESDPDLCFDLYGAGTAEDDLKELARKLGAANVVFHGRIPPADAFRRSAAAYAQIVCLRPTPLFEMTIPSKLSFALAAGAPILYGLTGEAAEIATESGAGIRFDAAVPETLVAAIRRLDALDATQIAAMGRRGRSYYDQWFAQSTLIERYVELFRTVAQPSTSRRTDILT